MGQIREEHWVGIPCVCGHRYDAFSGYKDETTKIDTPPDLNWKYRYHTCPKCQHIWDMRPDWPKPSRITDSKQGRREAVLKAAISMKGFNV
jgi:hypothetical protein